MAITKAAKYITELIYKGYGSDTGYLFGIEPNKRAAVEAVVQCALDHAIEYIKLFRREMAKDKRG